MSLSSCKLCPVAFILSALLDEQGRDFAIPYLDLVVKAGNRSILLTVANVDSPLGLLIISPLTGIPLFFSLGFSIERIGADSQLCGILVDIVIVLVLPAAKGALVRFQGVLES